jgi:2-iminobutanoate/2-iminopropanoate deaminase
VSSQVIIDPGVTRFRALPFSPAVRAGNLLLIGGQLPFALDGSYAGDDLRSQTRQVFSNLGAILEAAGGSCNDIVRVTTYFAFDIRNLDMVQEYLDARSEFLTHESYVSCGVQVAQLFDPRALLEVETTAVLDVGESGSHGNPAAEEQR